MECQPCGQFQKQTKNSLACLAYLFGNLSAQICKIAEPVSQSKGYIRVVILYQSHTKLVINPQLLRTKQIFSVDIDYCLPIPKRVSNCHRKSKTGHTYDFKCVLPCTTVTNFQFNDIIVFCQMQTCLSCYRTIHIIVWHCRTLARY